MFVHDSEFRPRGGRVRRESKRTYWWLACVLLVVMFLYFTAPVPNVPNVSNVSSLSTFSAGDASVDLHASTESTESTESTFSIGDESTESTREQHTCVVLGLMHTGTNYWTERLHCEQEGLTVPGGPWEHVHTPPVFSVIPWKHFPLWEIPEWIWTVGVDFYITTRDKEGWMKHMKWDYVKDGRISMSNRLFVRGDKGREHVVKWLREHVKEMPLEDYWTKYDTYARNLSSRGLVQLLPFDSITDARS